VWTKFIRGLLSEKTDRYVFNRCSRDDKDYSNCRAIDLYVHIPFCKGSCRYCPYITQPFDLNSSKLYRDALVSELGHYADLLKDKPVGSLYIGGGTPTLDLSLVGDLLKHLRQIVTPSGPIAIETTPSDISCSKIDELKKLGIDYISLGVQSFNPGYLALLGRNYEAEDAGKALSELMESGLSLVNADMIFAFPGQTLREFMEDLGKLMQWSPHQVTCYPLFTFPYSSVGRFMRLKRLKMPDVFVRRKMYYEMTGYFQKCGYKQTSVWSFTKNENRHNYSSVTRDHYLGLGVGAGSYTGKGFYFNTFSTKEYMDKAAYRRPTAIKMDITERMEKLFWLYWRFYETEINAVRYHSRFNNGIDEDFGRMLWTVEKMGMLRLDGARSRILNERGAFWIHLLQNYFALNYVNRVWTAGLADPWPERIRL